MRRCFLLVLVTMSCTSPTSVDTRPTEVSITTTTAVTTTTPRQCRLEPTESSYLHDDPAALAVALVGATAACAERVVLSADDLETQLAAAQLAAAVGGPLLPVEAVSEVHRLEPAELYVVGDVLPDAIPSDIDVVALSADEALAAAAELLGGVPILPAGTFRSTGRLVSAVNGEDAVIGGLPRPATGDDISFAAINDQGRGATWLVPYDRPDLLAPVLATAGSRDDSVLLVDPNELRNDRHLLEAVRGRPVFVAGDFDPQALSWQLPALLSAPELPGGGLLLFPGRRFVALYGNPTTAALGVLGEQGPAEAVARTLEVATGYDADGVPVIPAFELIATVASAGATADGNYSEEMSTDTLRPWIEVAAANGVYVILDLQPGRTDFLTQARLYEEFLALPHVGLALDPEWRLEPDQVHLRQIGSVEAAEVNQVSEWLAALVRERNLPQKFFLLHQFRLDMIENRDQIVSRPELATVIQMDGQGPLPTKYDTWNALTAGTQDLGIFWGWKNFYDEDTPRGGATAAEVLGLDPVPVYVSYQ